MGTTLIIHTKKYLLLVLFVGICFGQAIVISSEGKIIKLNDYVIWLYVEHKERGDIQSISICTTKYFDSSVCYFKDRWVLIFLK